MINSEHNPIGTSSTDAAVMQHGACAASCGGLFHAKEHLPWGYIVTIGTGKLTRIGLLSVTSFIRMSHLTLLLACKLLCDFP